MKQPSQGFAYGQLRSLSFIQLFHLCVATATWKWLQSRERSLLVARAHDCFRRRLQQPAYAAVCLDGDGNVWAERASSEGDSMRYFDEAW